VADAEWDEEVAPPAPFPLGTPGPPVAELADAPPAPEGVGSGPPEEDDELASKLTVWHSVADTQQRWNVLHDAFPRHSSSLLSQSARCALVMLSRSAWNASAHSSTLRLRVALHSSTRRLQKRDDVDAQAANTNKTERAAATSLMSASLMARCRGQWFAG
jgi:hypothetical protein